MYLYFSLSDSFHSSGSLLLKGFSTINQAELFNLISHNIYNSGDKLKKKKSGPLTTVICAKFLQVLQAFFLNTDQKQL